MDPEAPLLAPVEKEDYGKLQHGCEHYRRRCKIRAPCCDIIFPCRHCHNDEATDGHELVRFDVKQVVCSLCNTEQEVAQVCSKCGVNMGEYFCNICKFYDDDLHCDECGICRIGGVENFFHCQTCEFCFSLRLRDNHMCVKSSMKNVCVVCQEYLFDSIQGTTIMKCRHPIHMACLDNMAKQHLYRCPSCYKTVLDMSTDWVLLDVEIEETPMPEDEQREATILCNDCNRTSTVSYHILGNKCEHCYSYNTRE